MLQAAAAVSPRGIYVCGNATTKAGLTVAVVKDPMTSDYAFEAGNLFIYLFILMALLNQTVIYWLNVYCAVSRILWLVVIVHD